MKKQISIIAAAITLIFTIDPAIASSFEYLAEPASSTDCFHTQVEPYTKVVCLTDLKTSKPAKQVDYRTAYPYVLMSYFAEMYKVSSRKPAKQAALQARLDLLEKAGFYMVTDPAAIPDGIKSLFIGDNAPKATTAESGLIGGFYHDKSQFKARLFMNFEQKKVVIAIAGTNFGSKNSLKSAYSLGWGEASRAAWLARIVATSMQISYPNYTIELTGASQGGAIAQFAAVEPQISARAIVFNSLSIHPSITSEWTAEQKSRINHAYLEGELLNGDSYVSYAAQKAIQNKMPVDGMVVPIDDALESYINDAYYKASSAFEKARYFMTPREAVLHWTGSLLEAFEYHADYNFLPGLY